MADIQEWKTLVAHLIEKKSGYKIEATELTTPESSHGDLALACFQLAKHAGKSPQEIAKEIEQTVQVAGAVSSTAAGPYVNFHFSRPEHAAELLSAIAADKESYGTASAHSKDRLVLEYVSPNTNKPLHLGHLRNASLGWSLSKILEASGYDIVKAQIINDRGIHIMKPILAYERWGEGKTPESEHEKGDHFIAKYYVQYGEEAKKDESLDAAAQELLQKWEAGDKHVRELWKQLREWTLSGHEVTYKRIGITLDRNDFESEIYEDGKAIVREAADKGLARKREDGAIVMDVGEEKEKVLLRADGTSVYITQDLALAKRRLAETKAKQLIYVIGQEQDYQFSILFSVLDKLGIASKERLKLVSYHHVLLPEGRMKSREGTVVDTDNLLDELHELAAKEIAQRAPELDKEELARRSEVVALAAAKYYLLRVRPNSDIVFNPAESIAFVGSTGPYLLYTYARVQSIFRKLENEGISKTQPKPTEVTDSEWAIIMALASFPEAVAKAAEVYDPSILCDYTYGLAKRINDFYEKESVTKADEPLKTWRLHLLQNASIILKRSMNLLGLETLDQM